MPLANFTFYCISIKNQQPNVAKVRLISIFLFEEESKSSVADLLQQILRKSNCNRIQKNESRKLEDYP